MKVGARLAAAIVAAVAGIISYGHIRSVALAVGESHVAAALLPIGVDGLIITATLAMLEDARADRHPRMSARSALVTGVAFTIAGNIASAEPTWLARAVAAVPAVSFLLSVEVLARTGKPRTRENGLRGSRTQDHSPTLSGARPRSRRASTRERVAAAAARMPGATAAQLASRLGVSERTVQRYLPPAPAEASLNGRTR